MGHTEEDMNNLTRRSFLTRSYVGVALAAAKDIELARRLYAVARGSR